MNYQWIVNDNKMKCQCLGYFLKIAFPTKAHIPSCKKPSNPFSNYSPTLNSKNVLQKKYESTNQYLLRETRWCVLQSSDYYDQISVFQMLIAYCSQVIIMIKSVFSKCLLRIAVKWKWLWWSNQCFPNV